MHSLLKNITLFSFSFNRPLLFCVFQELAGEIILTLGEAFEIAYQMALKEKAEEDAVQFERQLSQSDQDDATSVSSKASVNTV